MKRFFAVLFFLCLFVFLLAGGVYTARDRLITPLLIRALADWSEKLLGARITAGEISGDYFHSLHFGKVRLHSPLPGTPVELVDIGAIETSYNLFHLFSGIEHFLNSTLVKVTDATVVINTATDTGVEEDDGDGAEKFSFDFFQGFPPVEIERVYVDIHGENYAVVLKNARGRLLPSSLPKPRADGKIEAEFFQLSLPGIAPIEGPATTRFQFEGGKIVVDSLGVGPDLILKETVVVLDRIIDGYLYTAGDVLHGNSTATVRISLDGSLLSGFIRLMSNDVNPLLQIAPSLAPRMKGAFYGEADFEVDFDAPRETQGALIFQVHDGQVNGVEIQRAAGEIMVENGMVAVKSFEGSVTGNTLFLENVSFPLPHASSTVRSIFADLSGSIEIHATDIPSITSLVLKKSPIDYQRFPPHELSLVAQAEAGTLTVTDGTFQIGKDTIDISTARVSLARADQSILDSGLSISARMEFHSLDAIADLFGFPPMKGSCTAKIEADGTLRSPAGVADVVAKSLEINALSLGDITGRIEADTGVLRIAGLSAKQEDGEISCSGAYDIGGKKIINLRLEAMGPGYPRFFAASMGKMKNFSCRDFRGELELQGDVFSPDGRLSAIITDASFDSTVLSEASFTLVKKGDHAKLEKFLVKTGDMSATASVSADLRAKEKKIAFQVGELALGWPEGTLVLNSAAMGEVGFDGSYSIDDMHLRGNLGDFSLRGEGKGAEKTYFLVRGENLSSKGLIRSRVQEFVSFTDGRIKLEIKGKPSSPAMTVEGGFGSISFSRGYFDATGRFHITSSSEGIQIKEMEFSSQQGDIVFLSGDVPFDPFADNPFIDRDFALNGEVSLSDLRLLHPVIGGEPTQEGSIQARLELQGGWDAPKGRATMHAKGFAPSSFFPAAPPGTLDASLVVDASEGRIKLTEFRAISPEVNFAAAGDWRDAPSLADLLRGDWQWRPGSLNVKASVEMPDISWLTANVKDIRRLRGSLKGDINLSGSADTPSLRGDISLTDGEVRISPQVPPIRNISLDAGMVGNILRLDALSGELGGSPFVVAGTVDLSSMSEPLFDLSLEGDNLLFFRSEEVKVRADSFLTLRGPVNKLRLEGELFVTDGQYTSRFDFLDILRGDDRPKGGPFMETIAVHDPPLKDARINVHIGAKAPFRIKNNITNGSVRPDLFLKGTGDLPYLSGAVYMEPTRISLPAGRLHIDSGMIRFLEKNPDRPELDLMGKARMMGYDITATIQGPYDEPVVNLSSVPPLPNEDLLLLVLTGVRPRQGFGSTASQRGSMNVVVFLGKDYLSRLLLMDDNGFEEAFLERFSLDIGRGVTRQGDDTIEASLRLRENMVLNGDAIFLTAEKDEFDDYNMGLKFVFQFQ